MVGVGSVHAFRYERAVERLPWMAAVGRRGMAVIGILEILGAIGLIAPAVTGVLVWLTPFAAVAADTPRDHEHATYRLGDGTTFVDVARLPDTENPLVALPAFAEFQRERAERCVEQPAPAAAAVVASYRS